MFKTPKTLESVVLNKQKPLALSSGEAEYYPMVQAGAQSIQTKEVLKQFNMGGVLLRLHSDSSAARGSLSGKDQGDYGLTHD